MNSAQALQAILRSSGQPELSPDQAEQMATYVSLLLRWNAKTNLTGARDEETLLHRHFAESIECARFLPQGISTLLDYGSGAGFPGLPCAICRPEIAVTLAESQGKKASFLREVVRSLGLGVVVHAGRVSEMQASLRFDAVTLRAVDNMEAARAESQHRLRPGGALIVFSMQAEGFGLPLQDVSWTSSKKMQGGGRGFLLLGRKSGLL